MSDRRISSVVCCAAACLFFLTIPSLAHAQAGCAALPPPSGNVIEVTAAQVSSLQAILDNARPGDTIQLADGTYAPPDTLVLRVDGVTLRSKSGNRQGVVIDGRYAVGDVFLVQRSNITIADLTVTRSHWHLVHVVPTGGSSTGTVLHNIRGIDGGEQFVKVNPDGAQYPDNGVVRCSSFEMTDTGRSMIRNNCYTGGIDMHQARGWQIYANMFNGFWCSSGLSEHAIHAWNGSRDTIVDRNVVMNSARGIGFGLGDTVVGRTFGDTACSAQNIGHYGGAITNNFVVATDARLFASGDGFDTGIGLEQSCATNVLHNTVVSTSAPRSSSIEWRFANTTATVANNLATHALLPRDGGTAVQAGNITASPLSWFVDVASANLHLLPTAAAAIDKAAVLATPLASDIDAQPRGAAADVGADEYVSSIPSATLSAPATVVSGGAIAVTWSITGGASPNDTIGLYLSGNSTAIDLKPTVGQQSGTATFVAPSAAGSYEARYLWGADATRIAVSNPIAVTAAPTNSGDTVAPTISIVSPRNGQQISKSVSVTVAASDNVQVTRVELYVDGTLKSTATTAPFTTKWNAQKASRGAHTLQAKAYDAAGNSTFSQLITVYR